MTLFFYQKRFWTIVVRAMILAIVMMGGIVIGALVKMNNNLNVFFSKTDVPVGI